MRVAVERIFGLGLAAIAGSQQEQERHDAHGEEQRSNDFGQRDETGFDHGVADHTQGVRGRKGRKGALEKSAKNERRLACGPALAEACDIVLSEPPRSRTSLRRPKILLVDDDPGVIRGLWRVLHNHRPEYQTNTAAGAAQALEALSELSYDVVVTDLQMPGGGGTVVLDALVRLYPETGRVVHSSQLESTRGFGCRAAHVVLAKPATDSAIVHAVEDAMQRVASECQRARTR